MHTDETETTTGTTEQAPTETASPQTETEAVPAHAAPTDPAPAEEGQATPEGLSHKDGPPEYASHFAGAKVLRDAMKTSAAT